MGRHLGYLRPGSSMVVPCWVMLAVLLTACANGPSTVVERELFIDVGDTKLFAEIRGRDGEASIVLYLHGGPASPFGVPVFRAYGGRLLEDQFMVVYLHQRGIMKSPRVPDEAHTVSNYVNDVHHVVRDLRREFPGRSISVLGHSWGGTLAYLYLSDHPAAIERLVTVSAPVNVDSMVRERLEMTLRWAESTAQQDAVHELSPLRGKSPIDHEQEFEMLAKWSALAHGGWARHLSRERIEAVVDDTALLPRWLEEQNHIEKLLRRELLAIDLTDSLPRITVPLLCIAGREDVDMPWYLVRDEIEPYGGPTKFTVFENSHHMPFIDEEALFAETVARFLAETPSPSPPPADRRSRAFPPTLPA